VGILTGFFFILQANFYPAGDEISIDFKADIN